jgi:hypothetical protein
MGEIMNATKLRFLGVFVQATAPEMEILLTKYSGDVAIKQKMAKILDVWLKEEVERIEAEKAIGSLEQKEKL